MFIKQLRERLGFSQKEVSEKVGISQNALCQYEKGVRKPPIKILIKLADFFGCTIDELVRGGEKSEL